jgi:Ca-activated chloride channel family protein
MQPDPVQRLSRGSRGTQHVRIIYEQVCPADGDRVDYLLPRTESVEYRVPWQIAVKIASKNRVNTVYSPSHALETVRKGDGQVTARLTPPARLQTGSFRLSYLVEREGLSASLMAYPEAGTDGGYFLLLAGPPSAPDRRISGSTAAAEPVQRRELILVLDRSGSMGGQKLDQVRAAALQVLEGLDAGEAFNVVVYSDGVESFASAPVLKTSATMGQVRDFLRGIRSNGGTNIHDALAEALRQPPTPGFLPLVLFLTDGLPTVGQTSERAIREVAKRSNAHGRRIFTFGVGADVNTPLLDRLAIDTRATSTYVLPGEDVEARVGQVFRRLTGPNLAEPVLRAVTDSGDPVPRRLHDVLPGRLPDLFEGDQLVVLGRYSGSESLVLQLEGTTAGQSRTFRMRFDLRRATTANAFVPPPVGKSEDCTTHRFHSRSRRRRSIGAGAAGERVQLASSEHPLAVFQRVGCACRHRSRPEGPRVGDRDHPAVPGVRDPHRVHRLPRP